MKTQWILLGSALALAGAGYGCGKSDEVATSQAGYRDANVVEQASTRSSESVSPALSPASTPSAPVSVTPETGPQMEVAGAVGTPDLLAKVSKDTVTRGETVDVVAEGSPDVVEMMLSDGYGTTQSLVFDAESNTWRTSYRVPLKMQLDRLGLSIRAKNDENHWRRVWVFLTLPENAAKALPQSAQADSVSP